MSDVKTYLRVPTPATRTLGALSLFYLVVRFFFASSLDAIGPYTSYAFELLLIGAACFLTRRQISVYFTVSQRAIVTSLLALPAGYLVYEAASPLGLFIPFQLDGIETVFFLLVVAPFVEEFLFRYFIWRPLETLVHPVAAYVITTLLFAFSHFYAFWFVGEDFRGFIYYQTAYTFFLALACGYSMFRKHSLLGAILIHFFFNLGFYFGFVG